MTLAELYRELEGHDWPYEQSDDHRVWTAGRENWFRLLREAKQIEGGNDLLVAYAEHVFSGEPYGTAKSPKPECMAGLLLGASEVDVVAAAKFAVSAADALIAELNKEPKS